MKIIFLDIDGVLNSQRYILHAMLQNEQTYGQVEPSALENLRRIVDQTSASIVLTSTLRELFHLDLSPKEDTARSILKALSEHQLELFDKTCSLQGDRGAEISQWLTTHDPVDSFVILDDQPYSWGSLSTRWIPVNGQVGLTLENTQEAIRLLNN